MKRFNAFVRRNYVGLSMTSLITLFVLIYFAPLIFITVPAGHAGVFWLRFFGGTITNWSFTEGMKVVPPWDKVAIYDLRLRQANANIDALTNDGLRVTTNITTRFRLLPDRLGFLHKHVGPNFLEILIIPQIAAEVRHAIARMPPGALYSADREELETQIKNEVENGFSQIGSHKLNTSHFVEVEDILIRSVTLPRQVRSAIEQKNIQLHKMQQYEYILKREQMESRRKAIEAAGIRAFQDTISQGINENYLKWKGIDATLQLAESPNAKVVVIGAGDEGLPIILGNWANDPPDMPPPAVDPTGEDRPENKRTDEDVRINQDEITDQKTGGDPDEVSQIKRQEKKDKGVIKQYYDGLMQEAQDWYKDFNTDTDLMNPDIKGNTKTRPSSEPVPTVEDRIPNTEPTQNKRD